MVWTTTGSPPEVPETVCHWINFPSRGANVKRGQSLEIINEDQFLKMLSLGDGR